MSNVLRITRTAYCEKCKKAHRPASGDMFLTFGGTHQSFTLMRNDYNVPRKNQGYTPHIFTVIKRQGNNLIVEKVCGMDGCGVVVYENTKKQMEYKVLYKSITEMTPKQWNAILYFKDTGYEI